MTGNKQILVLLNGPKHSGKDYITTGYQLKHQLVESFHPAAPSREHVERVLGRKLTEGEYNRDKDKPNELLGGHSIRECMIDYSENYMKPRYGKGIFTRLMLDEMDKVPDAPILFVTSLGFDEELDYIIKCAKFEPQNILLVHTIREGTDFAGDSRYYLTPRQRPIGYLALHNNGPIEQTLLYLSHAINRIQQVNF